MLERFLFILPDPLSAFLIKELINLVVNNSQVVYDTSGFLEKNRDPLYLDCIQVLASSKSHLPRIFASKLLDLSDAPPAPPFRSTAADVQKLSVATKFKVLEFNCTVGLLAQ